jgi:molecular chaperone GrpE
MSEEDMKKDQSEEIIDQSDAKVSEDAPAQELTIEEKCAQYELGWKRALADYENLKRSMAEQQTSARRRMKADFAQSMLPVMDNFAQAVKHAPDPEGLEGVEGSSDQGVKNLKNWLQGVLYIEKQFTEAFGEFGLERIETIGGAFDPHLHEAAGEKEGKEGEILEEVTSGWKMGEDVLRPARVIVGKSE